MNPKIVRTTSSIVVLGVAALAMGISGIPAIAQDDSLSKSKPNQHLDTMLSIAVPAADKIMKNGSVEVTIHLNSAAIPATLRVEANSHDVTHYFASSRCYRGPCDLVAKLDGNTVNKGWNYLSARVEGPNASAGLDKAQFYNPHGVNPNDATTGYAPPYAVHVYATPTQGLEIDYAPGVGSVPTYYPNASVPGCKFGELTLLTLNRTTLAPKSIHCYGRDSNTELQTYLNTLTKHDLIFGSLSGQSPLGQLNLSPIGGTDFSAKDAPTAYKYSVIGYGASQPGIAVESYKTTGAEPYKGVQGELVNIGSSTPMYGFRSTDSPAFAIRPAAAGQTAKITLGYVQSFPMTSGELPPNFTLPTQFTNATYTSPACSISCSGGFFTAAFDAYTLEFLWSNTYATNSDRSSEEMARMVADLNYHAPASAPRIIIITTVGNPFGSSASWFDAKITPSQALVDTFQRLNVSASAVKQLISGGSFSMIGIPGSLPAANQGDHNITKWYSSSLQQGEVGNLHGLLLRDNTFRYKPRDVAPFSIDASITNPNPDQLLSFAIPNQVGTAPAVAWPEMNTEAKRKAYAYASDEMNREDFFGGDDCDLPKVQCEDIRARYTSSLLPRIIGGIDPSTISYPNAGGVGFTQDDLTAVTRQLKREKQALANATDYLAVLKELNSNGKENIGGSLQSAATSVAASLVEVNQAPEKSTLSLATDIVGTAAAISSVVGVGFKPAAVVSGLLGTASSIMGMVNDTQEEPDPQVKKLADLLAQTTGDASAYAFRFNAAVSASTGMYFSGIYSDWFKLQTVGGMTRTPGSGWYFENVGNAIPEFSSDLVAEARTSFFEQIIPQYFNEVRVRKAPAWYYMRNPGYTQSSVDNIAIISAGLPQANLQRSYSWGYWPTAEYPKCEDFTFLAVKDTKNTWSSSLGTTLLGPPNFRNPNGNLGISREFLFDTSGLSIASDANYNPDGFCRK